MEYDALKLALKRLIIEELDLRDQAPETIEDDLPLFGEGLGLDSLDALQLAVAIEERFSIVIPEDDRAKEIFASVSALAKYVAATRPGG